MQAALPKVVVFDLDNCCWYPEMYEMSTGPPYAYDADTNSCATCDGCSHLPLSTWEEWN